MKTTNRLSKIFIFQDKRYKLIFWVSMVLVLLQLSIFKYFYPNVGFIHGDSFNYLHSAYQNLDINTYMIGYAKFLRLFSSFTTSDLVLFIFQYLFIQASGLLLVFSILYFYPVSRTIQYILLIFIVLNPLFLYMANYVSSDALFLALSFAWFTSLIWIINSPTKTIIILHAIVLFLAFIVRYNALIYPLISILAFSISNLTLRRKVLSITISLVLVLSFVAYTSEKYKELTGIWQYSPFSGWQLANNAMYCYRYVDSADRKPVPQRLKALDNMIRKYFDSTHDRKKYPVETLMASSVYMWDYHISPLYKYRESVFKTEPGASEFKKWSAMGPLYKDYGMYIIKHYPTYFIKYFIWPNANKYYAPPLEFLEAYNSDRDSTASIGQIWFNYKSNKLLTRTKDRKVSLLNFYPILAGITNILVLFHILFFIILKGTGSTAKFKSVILICSTFWAINASFTIFASTAALRFQAFPVILSFVFMLILFNWLFELAFGIEQIRSPKTNNRNNMVHHERAIL